MSNGIDQTVFPLVIVLLVGLAARNHLVVTAAAILLAVTVSGVPRLLGFLGQRSLQLGLVLLMVAVLCPFAEGKVPGRTALATFRTRAGWLAIVGGAVATYVNGRGVDLLRTRPEIVAGLLIGTIAGVVALRGIPVGPLAAAGVTALLLQLCERR